MPERIPTLDYATPEPRKRPRFLEKLNPKATWRTVVRKAILNALGGAAAWWLLLRFNHNLRGEWWPCACWVVAGLVGGAVTEWQPIGD